MRGGRGDADIPGQQVPDDGCRQRSNDNGLRDRFRNQQIIANRRSDRYAKKKRADKMRDRCQEQRYSWAGGPGGDHGCHDVGAVVHAVEEVEDQGKADENDDKHWEGAYQNAAHAPN